MPSLRELGRTENWWDSKIPPVLAFCYASVLLYDVPPAAAARCIGLIVFVGLCAGSYGHLINDLFDIEADRQAGKENSLSRLASWQRYAACAVTLVLGFAPAALFHYSRLSLGLLAVEYLLPTVYSTPPFRLKERGAAGVLCDTMGAHVVPCLYTISVLASAGTAHSSAGPWWWLFPACGAIWSLCLGIKGIIIHEYQDRADDMQAGVSTLATGLDLVPNPHPGESSLRRRTGCLPRAPGLPGPPEPTAGGRRSALRRDDSDEGHPQLELLHP